MELLQNNVLKLGSIVRLTQSGTRRVAKDVGREITYLEFKCVKFFKEGGIEVEYVSEDHTSQLYLSREDYMH